MKKLLLSLTIVIASLQMASCKDRPIDLSQLPQAAREFIGEHFVDASVLLASVDKELFDTHYNAVFAEGFSVEFDRKGMWRDVDCGRGRVPEAIIPEAIRSQLNASHPAGFVREISRDKRGYELTLNNGLELKFNKLFRLVEIDD